MQHPPVTISIAFVRGMVSGAQARGYPVETLLADAGIARELLDQPGARVTAAQYVELFRMLIHRRDDEGLGFFSRPIKQGSFALTLHSALSAPSLEAAIHRVGRNYWLFQDDVKLELVREGALAGFALRFTDSAAGHLPFMDAFLLRIFWRWFAWLIGGNLPAARFDFAFEASTYAGDYGKVFPAAMHFGKECSAFWFDATLLERRVLRDEAALRAYLRDAQANVIVPRRGDDVISARVRLHLQRTVPAWPDLAATASALHMSTATLQRRLAGEGTSFQSLKDELRRDMAIVRLSSGSTSLSALAFDLGFNDGAAFQRAFKSWTGHAPGVYRRDQVNRLSPIESPR